MATPEMTSSTASKPRIILGLMTFGPGCRIASQAELSNCLTLFKSHNHTELDTARSYADGQQESFTAAANYSALGFSIATKCNPGDEYTHRPASLRKSLETSLKELGTESVDIFYLHAPDRSVPFEETLWECDRLYREGKFKRLGLSNYTAFEVAEIVMLCRQHEWVRPRVAQYGYNAITRSIDPELVTACRRYGLDIVIFNPLAGGFFSGKYKPGDKTTPPTQGRFAAANYRRKYFRDVTFEALSLIEPVTTKHGLTMVETALRWCRHHSALRMGPSGNDGIIVGASSYEQLESNLRDLEKGPLPEEVVQVLDEAWRVAKGDTQNYWFRELKYSYDTEEALFGKKG